MKLLLKILIGAVLAVGAALVLALTCPDEASFKRWAKDEIPSEAGGVVEQAKGAALATQAKWTADYEDHVLWATVDAYQGGTERRYVGVLGTWFQIGRE